MKCYIVILNKRKVSATSFSLEKFDFSTERGFCADLFVLITFSIRPLVNAWLSVVIETLYIYDTLALAVGDLITL